MDKIEIVRGDSAAFDVTFRDAEENLIDLTGGTVFFTVKRRVTDDDDSAVLTVDLVVDDLDDIEPESGTIEIALQPEETSELSGVYSYDVQLKDSDGNIASSGNGRFVVSKDITIRTSELPVEE